MKIIIDKVTEFKGEIPEIFEDKLSKRHPARINEFLSARFLLLKGLKDLGIQADINQLEQTGHQGLQEFPEFSFSLSHTKSRVALIIASKDKYPYLGIDIENKDRSMTQKVSEYLNHLNDDIEFGLKKWVIKEAAFKYFSTKYNNENFWLKSLCIKEDKVYFEEDFCFFKLEEAEDYLYAITYREEGP